MPHIDVVELRARYQTERQKRMRAEGAAQFEVPDRLLRTFLDDPHAVRAAPRPGRDEETDVVIIGGGFGGLLAAARLKQAGVTDIRIIEKAGDFGGTWYWNRYPGIACDIESYIYMPLLEELGYIPTEKYASGPEIFEHTRRIGDHFALYDNAVFQTEVTELRWNEAVSRWLVTTDRGDAFRARFVCMSTGPLHKPKLPNIPGLTTFKGVSFHTSRWDYNYTGGDAYGGLTGLRGKRVGLIGTGATAVQCIPHLAESAGHLFVFQRTPSAINERNNRPTDDVWAQSLKPGWQRERMENFNLLISGGSAETNMVGDAWTEILGRIGRGAGGDGPEAERAQLADFTRMEMVRARVDAVVKDRRTADLLKPYYNVMCKRPCFHDQYLNTFNRSNVTLVDTAGVGVEAITERGVMVQGKEYALDCLIFSTGFEFLTSLEKRAGYQIHGRGGVTLDEAWSDGVSSLYGIHSRNFPNCLIMGNSQQAVTPNFTHVISIVADHIAQIVRKCLDKGIVEIEPTEAAEKAWLENVMAFAKDRVRFYQECTPGHFNNEGAVSDMLVRNGFYLGGVTRFKRILDEWRDRGGFDGFDVKHGPTA